jgi:hypothetical protein
MDRRILLAARLAWRFPALLNLPLWAFPSTDMVTATRRYRATRCPRPRLADRRSATPPAERQ